MMSKVHQKLLDRDGMRARLGLPPGSSLPSHVLQRMRMAVATGQSVDGLLGFVTMGASGPLGPAMSRMPPSYPPAPQHPHRGGGMMYDAPTRPADSGYGGGSPFPYGMYGSAPPMGSRGFGGPS